MIILPTGSTIESFAPPENVHIQIFPEHASGLKPPLKIGISQDLHLAGPCANPYSIHRVPYTGHEMRESPKKKVHRTFLDAGGPGITHIHLRLPERIPY